MIGIEDKEISIANKKKYEELYLARKKKCDEFYTNIKNGIFGMVIRNKHNEKIN